MERAVRLECVRMKAARRADFTFGVAARLRAPPALHAAGTATDATKATTAIRLEALMSIPFSRTGLPGEVLYVRNQLLAGLREVLPQELDGARVGELGGRGVVLGSVVLHEPVLRPGVDVSLAPIGSGLQLGFGVDELVVLGEVAEVGNAFGSFEDVAVDGNECSDLRPRLGHLPRIPGPKAESDDRSVLSTRLRAGEQIIER